MALATQMLEQEALPQQATGIIGNPAELCLQRLLRLGHRGGLRYSGLASRGLIHPLTTEQIPGPRLGAGLLV